MKKALYFVVVLLACVALASGFYIVYQQSKVPPLPAIESKIPNLENLTTQEDSQAWLEGFSDATAQNQTFQYPATELFVKFDFADENDTKSIRSIEIEELDEYKYFCVAQVLKQHKLESTYYKMGEKLRLMVFIEDSAVLKKFLEDLDYYRIQYVLK
ncbi:hypothetical protein CQA49_01515 [Helicobacter sp. MIT 00-7814]|uniref:hypothetical protein n=1 Tax=unclassified Helicobacter TaxID=2593540 RepID=UPI000E1F59C7|nr:MULTISPECIES: hypothetical protein [unclassified Helicobacter]RDU56366.1 hypothetical protein CQA37_01960 [Helicobacter sp. MIT 99-10781]RDU56449.1 hypothetical protein CQA49_01515 [Helicobacter sp. MIT 00-7814]